MTNEETIAELEAVIVKVRTILEAIDLELYISADDSGIVATIRPFVREALEATKGIEPSDTEKKLAVAVETLKHYADKGNWMEAGDGLKGLYVGYTFNDGYDVAIEALEQIGEMK